MENHIKRSMLIGEKKGMLYIKTNMLLVEITGMLYIGNHTIRFVRVSHRPRDSTK